MDNGKLKYKLLIPALLLLTACHESYIDRKSVV